MSKISYWLKFGFQRSALYFVALPLGHVTAFVWQFSSPSYKPVVNLVHNLYVKPILEPMVVGLVRTFAPMAATLIGNRSFSEHLAEGTLLTLVVTMYVLIGAITIIFVGYLLSKLSEKDLQQEEVISPARPRIQVPRIPAPPIAKGESNGV
jgi:hypothetical protein